MPSLSRFGDTTFAPSNYRAGSPEDLFKVSSMLNIVAGSDLCSFYSFIFWFAWVLSGLVVSAAPGEQGECNSSHRNLYNDENCRLEMQIREKYFNFKLIVSSSCKQNVHYSPPAQITLETWAIWREILLTWGLYNLLFPSPQLTWTLTFAFRLNINFSCLFSRKLTRCSERNKHLSLNRVDKWISMQVLRASDVRVWQHPLSRPQRAASAGAAKSAAKCKPGPERAIWLAESGTLGPDWSEPRHSEWHCNGELGRVYCVITDWGWW